MGKDNQQLRWQPSSLLWVALLCLVVGSSNADEISSVELCACSPRVYEFTFDFSLECEPLNVDLESGGIVDASCLVSGFDDLNVTDLVPVAVSSVQVIEIGKDGTPISIAQEKGDFRDGGTFTYTSASFEGAVAPRAFQVRAIGRNEAGEPLVLQWAVTYSNNCGVFPVLQIDDSIGWTIFTGLAEPLELVCPEIKTPAPTFGDVVYDTTEEPSTPYPTHLPTKAPSFPPSPGPSMPPASPPPTPPPTEPPTKPPVEPARRSFIESADHEMFSPPQFDSIEEAPQEHSSFEEEGAAPQENSFDPPPSVDDKEALSSMDGLHAYELHEGGEYFSGEERASLSMDEEMTHAPVTSIDHGEKETTDPPLTSIEETTDPPVASIDHDEALHDQSGHSLDAAEEHHTAPSMDHDEASHDQSGHSLDAAEDHDTAPSKDHDKEMHDQSGQSQDAAEDHGIAPENKWIGFETEKVKPVEENPSKQLKPIEEGAPRHTHKTKPRSKARSKAKSKSVETKGRRRRLRRGKNHRERGL